MKEEYGTSNFYSGADYGLDPSYGDEYSLGISPEYAPSPSQFGLTTDPRTAAQLREVSSKLSTGAKTIELTGITPGELESIPQQHFKEINRLKKLVGTDLTFHGPIIEPTGVTKNGWNEAHREQAERQMWSAVERAHDMDPDGNLVVTFHSSASLPEPETKVVTEVIDPITGKKKMIEQIKEFWVVDERSGQFQNIPLRADYLKGEGRFSSSEAQKKKVLDAIDKQNKDAWFKRLQGMSFHAGQGADLVEKTIDNAVNIISSSGGNEEKAREQIAQAYKKYLDGEDVESFLGKFKDLSPLNMSDIVRGDLYLRDAYQDLQTLFNDAYESALKDNSKENLKKLDKYKEEISGSLDKLQDPTQVGEFARELVRGVNVLRSIEPPKGLKPLREFAVDKSADTFANLAFNSYKNFGKTAPIMSIENPPAGTGLSRAEDLRDIVKESRKKLERRLIDEKGLSEREAEKQAEKLIGVTWDVGHINMIRKFGYDKEQVIGETKKIAPFVKHVHLSDNFGLEHTELPMGMGNVPTKPMLEAIREFNKKAKHIVETGGAWFRDFKISPLKQTLKAFGSSIYSMQLAPQWDMKADVAGGYFIGQGRTLPNQHFSIYGAGFSNLPSELGGPAAGGGSRLGGGTPNA